MVKQFVAECCTHMQCIIVELPSASVGILQTWCAGQTRKIDIDALGQDWFIFSFCILIFIF